MSPDRPHPPPPPPPPPTRKRRAGTTPREERMRAARVEIGKAMRGLRSLRGLFIVDAILLGLIFAISLASDSFGIFQLVAGVMFVTAAAGAVLVVYQPWAWGLVLAIGHVLLALIAPGIVTIGIAVLLVFAVKIAADTRRLLRLYPDAWQGRNTTYSGRDAEEVGSKWCDRARQDRRKHTRKVLLFVVLPAVLLVAAMIFFSQRPASDSRSAYTPPPVVMPTAPLEPAAEAFRTTWNASDLDGAMEHVLPAERDRIRGLVRKVIRRRKWDGAFPAASAATLEEYDASHFYTWHDLDGYGSLRVSWEWSDGRWWIVRVKFKKGS